MKCALQTIRKIQLIVGSCVWSAVRSIPEFGASLRDVCQDFRAVVLNLGSIEPQGLGESVSGIQRQEILSNKSKINKIHDTHFIFPTPKGSINACMELVGFSISNEVKNHCSNKFD